MTLLRLWLLATAAFVTAIGVWAFAPVLLFFVLLAIALGLLSALMIALARALQVRRQRRGQR